MGTSRPEVQQMCHRSKHWESGRSRGGHGEDFGQTTRLLETATLFTVEVEAPEEASEGILGINARSAALETRYGMGGRRWINVSSACFHESFSCLFYQLFSSGQICLHLLFIFFSHSTHFLSILLDP